MTMNPFLDPAREIQQGRTDEDIFAAHERRLREAAEDAAMRRPAGMQGTDGMWKTYKSGAEKSIDEKFKKFNMPTSVVAGAVAASMAAGMTGAAVGAALGTGGGAYLAGGLGAALYGYGTGGKLDEYIQYKIEKKELSEKKFYENDNSVEEYSSIGSFFSGDKELIQKEGWRDERGEADDID